MCEPILKKIYDKIVKQNSITQNQKSVLLLDGWKNSTKNEKYVGRVINNANREKIFLNSWDFTVKNETALALEAVVAEAIIDAKKMYNTDIYAVATDNASSMICMGKKINTSRHMQQP